MLPVSSAIGMNTAGRDLAPLGVLPAQQRLEADGLAGGQRDHRLVVDGELVVGDGPAQVVGQIQPLVHPARSFASYSSNRARPWAFARYIAASASLSISSAVGPASAAVAMPIEAVTRSPRCRR